MKPKNIKEFKELIEKYESIPLKDIEILFDFRGQFSDN